MCERTRASSSGYGQIPLGAVPLFRPAAAAAAAFSAAALFSRLCRISACVGGWVEKRGGNGRDGDCGLFWGERGAGESVFWILNFGEGVYDYCRGFPEWVLWAFRTIFF